MSATGTMADAVYERGQSIYEMHVRPQVDPARIGEYVALYVARGASEIDTDRTTAMLRAAAKHPGRDLYIVRVGHETAVRIGRGGGAAQR